VVPIRSRVETDMHRISIEAQPFDREITRSDGRMRRLAVVNGREARRYITRLDAFEETNLAELNLGSDFMWQRNRVLARCPRVRLGDRNQRQRPRFADSIDERSGCGFR